MKTTEAIARYFTFNKRARRALFILKCFDKKKTIAEICKASGISSINCYRYLRLYNLPSTKLSSGRPINKPKKEIVKRLRDFGFTYQKIADLFEVSRQSVHHFNKRAKSNHRKK